MKLPQVQYRQVQSLGRHNLSSVDRVAAAEQAQGQTMQRAFEAVADVTADYIERKENQEYNTQIAEYQIELREWQARHGAKAFYTAEEIGPSVSADQVPRETITTDDMGNEVREERLSIPAHEVYPHLLKQKLEGMIRNKASKITNPHLRQNFLEKANVDAAGMVMEAQIQAEQAQRQYVYESGVEKAQDAADSGNLVMAQFLVENLETDDLTKKRLMEEMDERVEIYEVNAAIRSNDPETQLTMRSILEDPNYDGALSEEQRQGAINDLNSRITQLLAEAKHQMTMQHDMFISDAYVGIDEGTFNLNDVEAGYQLWQEDQRDPSGISPQERIQLRDRIRSRNAARESAANMSMLGASVIANGGNPKNSDHQNAVDAYVEQNQVTDLRELERITIRSSIMPQVVEDFLSIAALHDAEQGGEQIGPAVEMYGRLFDQKREVLKEIGKEANDILADTHLLVRGGMNAQRAYAIARENAQIKPEVRDARETSYRQHDFADDNAGELSDFMDEDDTFFGFEGGFFNTTVVEPDERMQIEFENMTHMHYLRTGDIKLARKRAWADMTQIWSPSEVGATHTGDGLKYDIRPMKYAPERVMAVSAQTAQARLEAFARDQELDPKQLIVISDDRTARDGSWAIYKYDPETDVLAFHPERWVGQDWADAAQQFEYAKAVDEAVEKRAAEWQVQEEAEKARSDPFWLSKGLRDTRE